MNPVPEILSRELHDDRLRQILAQLSLGLERTADFGTHLIKWFSEVDSPERHRIAFVMLLRQFLELLDAISILVRQSSIDPCKPILRSMFEVLLSLKYMFQEDTKRRTTAFLVSYILGILKEYRRADPSTPEGQEQLRKSQSNQMFPPGQITFRPEWSTNIQMLQTELAFPDYAGANLEYDRLRAEGRSNPKWYSFFGGPHNIEQLCARVGLSALYESHYRRFSASLHGMDIFADKLTSNPHSSTLVVQIRYVKDAQLVCANAFVMALDVFSAFVIATLPNREPELKSWYSTIHEYGVKINGPDFIHVSFGPGASGG